MREKRVFKVKRKTDKERFFEKVEKTDTCWLWKASIRGGGYGQFFWNRKIGEAHRFSYELVKGEIAEGLDIDHLCRVRNCVNPNHLEAVTRRENLIRGAGTTAINFYKDKCSRGHKFDEKNTYVFRNARKCRICATILQASYREKYGSNWIREKKRAQSL